jgi:hypothetical protein
MYQLHVSSTGCGFGFDGGFSSFVSAGPSIKTIIALQKTTFSSELVSDDIISNRGASGFDQRGGFIGLNNKDIQPR